MLLEFVNSEGDTSTIDTEAKLIFGDDSKESLSALIRLSSKEDVYETCKCWGLPEDMRIPMIKQAITYGYFIDINDEKYTITEESRQELERFIKRDKPESNNLFWTIGSLIFGLPLLLLIIL